MPIYEYRCATCSFQKEFLQKISDPPLSVCPECGAATFTKMVTAAGFQLKGSGWYATDFRNSGAAPAAKTDSAKTDGANTDSKSSTAASGGADSGAASGEKTGDSKSSESSAPAPSKSDASKSDSASSTATSTPSGGAAGSS